MTSPVLKRVFDLALDLPENERAELAHDLIASLHGTSDQNAVQAWKAEFTKRLAELESGRPRTISAEDALRGIDERLR
jgi:putative addiction module component (TIGR02574 family)